MNALATIAPTNADAYRASTDAAGLCRDIVTKTAKNIQGRRYVGVEGWEAIAIAHGCAASALDVERVNDEGMSGFKCVGVVRRMSDGQEIARGEGFLGDDEKTWAGRAVYARRAMVQTRAISRACRSAFAHVVVMIDAGLSTTPAEEVPAGGFDDGNVIQHRSHRPANVPSANDPVQDTGRAPPPKLQGPIKTRAALRIACGEFVRELHACEDADMLEAFLASPDAVALVEQVQAEHPFFYDGDGGEFKGLAKEIEERRALIAMGDAHEPEGDYIPILAAG